MRRLWIRLRRGGLLSVVAVLLFLLTGALVELRRVHPVKSALRQAMDLTVHVDVYDENGWPVSSGSGVILDGDEVVTCLHVLEGGEYVTVTTQQGLTVEAMGLSDTSAALDLAIVYAPWLGSAIPELAVPEVGSTVFSLGYSRYASSGQPDLVYGSISGRDESGFLEHSSPVPSGFSGGGVWDERGRLVGINARGRSAGPAMSFAAPASAAATLHKDAGDELVYEYPPRSEWPNQWWPERAYRLLHHQGLAALADSIIVRLRVSRNVDSLLTAVREDALNPYPHGALLLNAMSQGDIGGLHREAVILASLDSMRTVDGVYDLTAAVTMAVGGQYDAALDRLEMSDHCDEDFRDLFEFARGIIAVSADETGKAVEAYQLLKELESPLADQLLQEVYPEFEMAAR